MFPALRADAPDAATLTARLRDTAAFVRRVRDLGVAEPRRTIPRQLFPHRIEENYASSLLGVVSAARDAASHLMTELPRLVDAAGLARDRVDALRRSDVGEARRAHELIQAARERMRFATQRTVTLPLIAGVARRASAHQREQFARQVKAALGVDLWTSRVVDIRTDARRDSTVRLDAAAHTIDAFIAHNVSLIKSLGDQPLDEVEGMVAQAFSAGTRHETLARDIERRFDVARSSARLIARDQLGKLNGQLAADRQKEIGVKRWEWQTVGDGAVRKTHAALEDNVYSYSGDPQPPFMPGEEVNCVPGDALVSLHAPALVAYRRRYSGQLTELVPDSGESVRCTPNHPVLTARGWVPAHLVEVGDYLVEAPPQRVELDVDYPQRGHSTAEQVFRALFDLGAPHRIAGAAARFHGDGSDEEVDVVGVDWGLFLREMSEAAQVGQEHELARAAESTLALGHAPADVVALARAANRRVRGAGEPGALGRARLGHSHQHRSAATSWLDACRQEHAASGRASAIELLGDGLLAHAVRVQPDDFSLRRVARASTAAWSGVVYNFETATGWFSTHGLIVHNCRCSPRPIFEEILRAIDSGEDLTPLNPDVPLDGGDLGDEG